MYVSKALTLVAFLHEFLCVFSHSRPIVFYSQDFFCKGLTAEVRPIDPLMDLGQNIVAVATFNTFEQR